MLERLESLLVEFESLQLRTGETLTESLNIAGRESNPRRNSILGEVVIEQNLNILFHLSPQFVCKITPFSGQFRWQYMQLGNSAGN